MLITPEPPSPPRGRVQPRRGRTSSKARGWATRPAWVRGEVVGGGIIMIMIMIMIMIIMIIMIIIHTRSFGHYIKSCNAIIYLKGIYLIFGVSMWWFLYFKKNRKNDYRGG